METAHEIKEKLSEYEIERGKPMPSFEHSQTQMNLIIQIAQQAEYKPYPELNLDLNGDKSIPDVVLYDKKTAASFKGLVWITVPPLLTIEILSPAQGLRSLFDNAALYLHHGVEEAWVVIPEIQSITVCKPNGYQKIFVEGTVTHSSTGVTVSLEKIFQ